MITNADYLIQKYAEAREKFEVYNDNGNTGVIGRNYWRGVMDTYLNLLCAAFPGWAEPSSVGYYVMNKSMTYDEALNKVSVTSILK